MWVIRGLPSGECRGVDPHDGVEPGVDEQGDEQQEDGVLVRWSGPPSYSAYLRDEGFPGTEGGV